MRKFTIGAVVAALIVGAAYGGLALASSSGSYTYTLANGSTLRLAITATANSRTTRRAPSPQTATFGTPSGQVAVTLTPTYAPPPSSSSSSSTTLTLTTATSTTATSTTATTSTATLTSGSGVLSPTQPTDVTSWIAPGTFAPSMSDAAAAADVTLTMEAVPANTAANDYVPTSGELAAFHSATQFNPLTQYVDGLDGISNPCTDDLIQWASHKWGIPDTRRGSGRRSGRSPTGGSQAR